MISTNNVLRMVRVSLGLNIVVLVPVCAVLILNFTPFVDVWGLSTPARGILLSMYLSILILSVGLWMQRNPILVAPLLAMQICYKVTTPITVGTITNPVVISNLAIASVHAITLWLVVAYHRNTTK
ncbi:MAG: hypothetical protein ACK5NX_03215 [Armatimonadota bacterium]